MLEPHRRDHRGAILTALVVTALWSSSWVLIRVVLDDEGLAPVTFAGLRYGLAALALAGWTLSRPAPRRALLALDRPTVRGLAIFGLVFVAVTQGAQFVAIDNQPAATTSLVLSLTPLAVAALSARMLDERTTRRQVAGTFLVAVGAALFFAGDLGATAIGLVAALIGLVANVAGALMGRSINRDHTLAPVVVTSVSMSVGAVALLTVGVVVEGWPHLSGRAALVIVWLAVVNTAVAFTLWNSTLRRLSAVESSAVNNTMLIQIAVLAWIFLGEAPGLLGAVGVVVVSAGVLLAQTATVGRAAAIRQR